MQKVIYVNYLNMLQSEDLSESLFHWTHLDNEVGTHFRCNMYNGKKMNLMLQ